MENSKPSENIGLLLKEDPFVLLEKLTSAYSYDFPDFIDTPEDMKKAGILLRDLSMAYSYLIYLQSYAKLLVRDLKREKASKDEIDKAVDRKEIISNLAEAIKLNYSTVSRMITIKQQINYELKMTDSR